MLSPVLGFTSLLFPTLRQDLISSSGLQVVDVTSVCRRKHQSSVMGGVLFLSWFTSGPPTALMAHFSANTP